jgi:hypothetical protein
MYGQLRRIALTSAIAVLSLSNEAVADPVRLQPIALLTSQNATQSLPKDAFDGNSATSWNAGGYPTQWIQLDLGRTTSVGKMRLQVSQYPAGNAVHTISVGQDPSSLHDVYTSNTSTPDGNWLEFHGDGIAGDKLGNVRYIRITTTSGPSWVSWREIEIYPAVEYFGYFCDACDAAGGNFMIDTTGAGANLVYIGVLHTTDLAPRLAEAKMRGVKAIVALDNLLFGGNGNDTQHMAAGWQTTWAETAAIINPEYADTVVAFYIHDEPYSYWFTSDVEATRANLVAVANKVKQDFPTKPVAALLEGITVSTLNNNCSGSNDQPGCYVGMLDWVGFDCYDDWTSCGTYHLNIDSLVGKLRRWLRPNGAYLGPGSEQRMIAVPAARLYAGATGEADQYHLISTNTNKWQYQIANDAKYIAILPYIWQNYGSEVGASNLVWSGDISNVRSVAERLYQLAYSFLPLSDRRIFPASYCASNAVRDKQNLFTCGQESYTSNFPFPAFDQSAGTAWTSGNYPGAGGETQWIRAYFTGSTRVKRISFTVSQTPSGNTTHQIWGKNLQSAWVLLGTLQGTTHNGDVVTWTWPGTGTPPDVSTVEIDTTASPSWVGWRDIQFFAADPVLP